MKNTVKGKNAANQPPGAGSMHKKGTEPEDVKKVGMNLARVKAQKRGL